MAVMLRIVFSAIASLALVLQSASGIPIRLGDVGRLLSEDDIHQIEQIGVASGGAPWLLVGHHSMIGEMWFVDAYLQPTTASPSVRRGTLINVSSNLPEVPSVLKVWTLNRRATRLTYAQVAVSERSFGNILGDQDVNRPFRISGEFSDDELISLVRFIRTDPSRADERTLPILFITRESLPPQADGPAVRVGLRQDESATILLTLKRTGQTWTVTAHGGVIQ